MKILLVAINAKYIHSNLAIYSLKRYAEGCGAEIKLAEYTINHQSTEILESIYKEKADVICFSCYIWNYSYVEELAVELKKLCPQVPIWVGGPEVSFETEELLATHPAIDGVMVGEGEATFRRICEVYHAYGRLPDEQAEEIAGIAYRDKRDKIIINPPAVPMDMDKIPFCYGDMSDFEHRIVYYESSRGCPFSCSYCLSSVDKKMRYRSLELVKRELDFFIEHEVPQVKFVDRTFNCNHAHAMEIWNHIKEKDKGITNFHFEVAADLLTSEELDCIAGMRPGLIQLEIGVQSTNHATIREIHRAMDLEKVKQVVMRIKERGNVHQHLDLIAGLPYEDYETFRCSFNEIYALHLQQLQLGFLKVLKGSYMYEHATEYGMIYQSKPPYEILATDWLSYEDVLKIKQVEEMLEVYYNSGQFEVTMKVLESYFADAFELFAMMGRFYEKQDYYRWRHTRLKRCEILLDFIGSLHRSDINMDMLKQALTFDLYYREDMKSRPYFAWQQENYKRAQKKLCMRGKRMHLEIFSYDFPTGIAVEPYGILFDYERRNPLTNQAHLTRITHEELHEEENT